MNSSLVALKQAISCLPRVSRRSGVCEPTMKQVQGGHLNVKKPPEMRAVYAGCWAVLVRMPPRMPLRLSRGEVFLDSPGIPLGALHPVSSIHGYHRVLTMLNRVTPLDSLHVAFYSLVAAWGTLHRDLWGGLSCQHDSSLAQLLSKLAQTRQQGP